jgi:hypothetical protein
MNLRFLLLFAAGCGGSIEPSNLSESADAAAEASAPAYPPPDASAPETAAPILGLVSCPWGVNPNGATLATYEKGCATVVDCAIGFHLATCCGGSNALGVRADEAPRFARHGGICGDEYATCDCDYAATTAEDGNRSTEPDAGDVAVDCVTGVCLTRIAK